jgi:hypothetical protein
LLEAEFALDARQHKIDILSATRKSLIWAREDNDALITANPSKIRDYLGLLERQEYSYLMHDGGIIQIAFTYDGRKIQSHRLNYHPCPFPIGRRDLENFGGGLIDLILESYMGEQNVSGS